MYKPDHQVNWYKYEDDSIPAISATHDMLQTGYKKQNIERVVSKKKINFVSFVMNEIPSTPNTPTINNIAPIITTYTRDYQAHFNICPPKPQQELDPDPLFNRKPPNMFDKSKITVHKFLDDHITGKTDERQKIDFLRQVRNSHYHLV